MDAASSEPSPLICPQCHSRFLSVTPLQGKEGHWFAGITCHQCGEQGFFQIELPDPRESEGGESLEWEEWVHFTQEREEFTSLVDRSKSFSNV